MVTGVNETDRLSLIAGDNDTIDKCIAGDNDAGD